MKRTVLITGAAKRLGKEMSIHLAGKGWNIAIHYNSSENHAQSLKSELQKNYHGQKFRTFQANLSQSIDVEKLIPSVTDKMGSIDLLINNASIFDPGYLKETDLNLFNTQMAVNLQAPFILSRDFARHTKKGLIINFIDTRITSNKSDYAIYSISKKALWELTKMSALEFAPQIRVNAVAPGVTLPPEDKDENYLLDLAEKIPMKKPGGIEPILQSLDYIISNTHLTGQLLFADGGENLGKNHS